MITTSFLLASLSLQKQESSKGDAASEGTVRFDVLKETTTTLHAAAARAKQAINELNT